MYIISAGLSTIKRALPRRSPPAGGRRRVSYIGITLAFQANERGSTPLTRSLEKLNPRKWVLVLLMPRRSAFMCVGGPYKRNLVRDFFYLDDMGSRTRKGSGKLGVFPCRKVLKTERFSESPSSKRAKNEGRHEPPLTRSITPNRKIGLFDTRRESNQKN